MKSLLHYLLTCLLLSSFAGRSQQASNLLVYESHDDQINYLRSSLGLHEAEENVFWPIYEQYEQKLNETKLKTFDALSALTISDDQASAEEKVNTLFESEYEEAELRKDYFQRILTSTNGTVALQFLQTEALFDLLLKSRLYEKLTWQKPAWTPAMMKNERTKVTVLEFTLGVTPEQVEQFRDLTEDFEFDYSRVVGHQLVFFEQCIDGVDELTPGQCKSLGNSFATMQVNEVAVKERYFRRLKDTFDPMMAAKFISFQEYFYMMAKLKVWSDYLAEKESESR